MSATTTITGTREVARHAVPGTAAEIVVTLHPAPQARTGREYFEITREVGTRSTHVTYATTEQDARTRANEAWTAWRDRARRRDPLLQVTEDIAAGARTMVVNTVPDDTEPIVAHTPQRDGTRNTLRELEAQVPAGRYAVDGDEETPIRFYRVDKPTDGKWVGYTFISQVTGANPDGTRVRSLQARQHVLATIAEADPREAMLRYGREVGHCGHCGRLLTNDESRAAGIGPVCRDKIGS